MSESSEPPRPTETRRWILFGGYGLRPFFLCAAVYALVALGAWLHRLSGADFGASPIWVSPAIWHGHEMLFGYAGAVIAGFMLTAVPSWTGAPILKPGALFLLFLLWLAGRLALWQVDFLSPWVVAAADMAFLPALALLAGAPVWQRRMYRNLVFVAVLLFLTGANAMIHMDAIRGELDLAATGLRLSLDGVVLLVVIVGGRVIPAFTTNVLRRKFGEPDLRNPPNLGKLAIVTTVAMVLADAVVPETAVAGALAVAAGVLALLRLSGWRGFQCRDDPLIWILHVGYLWLGIGLLLKGLSDFAPDIPPTAAIHALATGAIGSMTLGVMSRAALGHTGRVLAASPLLTLAYFLLNIGAMIRVAGVWQPDIYGVDTIILSAGVWSAAFVLFIVLFAPILLRPRIDGRPG